MHSWLYINNITNTLRFALGEKGNDMVACLGINPSTATPDKLDRTMESVKRIANHNGYDGWVMFNVYPQRATDPAQLDSNCDAACHEENLNIIKHSIRDNGIQTLWLAYGDLIHVRPYLVPCLYELHQNLKPLDLKYVIIQEPTLKGHPRHPLYKSAQSTFNVFDFDVYIQSVIYPLI